ncbi:GNAT family N-acetyltransferase [Pleurocapsales cyanobacterium LEGE 10410]|nr:GNAT family N-acetyltransferase [Pleurocapsales cyanobacterium LEGE 10410]
MTNFESKLQIGEFTMRSLQVSDLDALAEIWTDPQVTRFLPSRGMPISRQDTQKFLQAVIEHWQERQYGVWAITENPSQMIGYCGLRYLNELNEVEVLYGLAKAYWGRGIATKAAKAAISYGLEIVNLEQVIAMALPDNIASINVIEKAGLRYQKQIYIFGLNVLYYSKNK